VDTLSYKTISANKKTIHQEWLVIDAENQIVGRLATQIANLLRGKHKTNFTPHVVAGDHVIVINADKVRFSGKKMEDKIYLRHTGYPGGQRETTPERLLKTKPEDIIIKAVRNMLPKNKLQAVCLKNLHVFAGAEHIHQAQSPKVYKPKI
jgi:large subunit ribosomal protein L13